MGNEMRAFPHKPLAFISLALGFLIIWTAVLAGILLSRTVKDQSMADDTIDVFHIQEHIGKISFALGHEMVTTTDWLLSDNPEPNREALKVTWKMTDAILKTVRKHGSVNHWIKGGENSAGLLDAIEAKLFRFRRSLNVYINPIAVVHFFSEVNKMMLKRWLRNPDLLQSLPLPSASYTLFVKGMFLRFGEVSLGTVFVKSDIPLNKTEFFEMRTGSEELIESAFSFLPRAHNRWRELHDQEIATRNVLRSVSKQLLTYEGRHRAMEMEKSGLTADYLDGVKEQIATLLLSKEILNSAVGGWVDKTLHKARNSLAFHLSISVVALGAVLVCLVVTGCTFKHIGELQSQGKLTQLGGEAYYTTSDKARILPDSPNYLKPQCYL